MKRLGIVAKIQDPRAIKVALEALQVAEKAEVDVVLEEDLAKKLGRAGRKIEEMDVDGIVIIGGDGTVLRTLLRFRGDAIILPFRLGKRGFLAELDASRIEEGLKMFLEGDYFVEEGMKLSATARNVALPDALNELLIVSRDKGKLVSFSVYQDDVKLMDLDADGLIVATPIGSTAHSLSAGGPILGLGIEGIVLTPICPLQRAGAVVVPGESHVRIETRPEEVSVVIDGNFCADVLSPIDIERSTKKARFARFERKYFGERIRRCLGT